MKRRQYFHSAEHLERNIESDFYEKYQNLNGLSESVALATSDSDTQSNENRKKSLQNTKRLRTMSHKITLDSLFSRKSKKYKLPTQRNNNRQAQQLSHDSLLNVGHENENLRGTKVSYSRQWTGWKSRFQNIKTSFRQSIRFKRDNNDNFERNWCRKTSKDVRSSKLHLEFSQKRIGDGKTNKRNVEIPAQKQLTCSDNSTRGKKSGKKTSFVKGTIDSESVVGSRKSEQDKPPGKNNKVNTKQTRIKMFSQEPFNTHHLTEREFCCETKTGETLPTPFSKLWKTKSLNFIGNFFKRAELPKKEERNFVEADTPLKLRKSLSTTNTADLGFLLKRDPYLASFSSLDELSFEGSEEDQYTWDFSDYIAETKDKYRSLKRSRAALIFPQSVNRSYSLDDVSVRSGTEFCALQNTRSMEAWRDNRRASSPHICVEFYNDDGSISPSSTSNQDTCDEDSTDKESIRCDVFTPCLEGNTKNGVSNDLRDLRAETHSHVFQYSNQICNHRGQEQSSLCKVSRSEEFCKCHLQKNDRKSNDGVKSTTSRSNYLESDHRIVTTTEESNENVEKLNKGLSARDCVNRESDPDFLVMGNHGSYNLINPDCRHDLPTQSASSENFDRREKKISFYRRMEQTENIKQSSNSDAEIEKNAQCCRDKDLPKHKTNETESVKICTDKRQFDCNKPNERASRFSCKSRLKRQNAISEFNTTHNVSFMRKINIFSSTESTDKTFHPLKVANGFLKTNTRAPFDSNNGSCHQTEIKGDGTINRPDLQNCGLSCKQNNMALKVDLKSCHNFNGVDEKNGVPDYKNCLEDSPVRVSSGSSEIFVSRNNSIEMQSENENNHLLPPSVDSGPETITYPLSTETQKTDSQVVKEGICPKCDKIIASNTATSPIRIARGPMPRHLTSSSLENHLSRSLPSLMSPSSRKYLDNESPIESPSISPLSSSPESDSDRRKVVINSIPHSLSPVLRELNSQGFRSSSCNKLDEAGKPAGSPPQITPRVKSLGHLAHVGTAGRKIKVMRHRGQMSVPRMGKRHSLSTDSCSITHDSSIEPSKKYLQQNSNYKNLHEMSSLTLSSTGSETGSKVSLASEDCMPNSHFAVPFGRSASVPGFIYAEQSSSVPDDVILTKGFSLDQNLPLTDDSDLDGTDDEEYMDAPEAFAEALWDHVTMDPDELSFSAGDVITIISWTDTDWWWGHVGGRIGWFPAPFVRVRVSQTLACEEGPPATPLKSRRGTTLGALSNRDVRARVVEEILNTEKDYVKNLKDVVEGYLRQARKRPGMFSEERLNTIFSNVEQIYIFHKEILQELRSFYNAADPCASEIGSVFLENKRGFDIYSEYCNNHPHAVAELKAMSEKNKYKHFFEACRLLQEMVEISLDGFLLTPVQKICKYPLQLAELLKYTECDHKDYVPVKMALETMKSVAATINERKRKVECINKIAKWQNSIEGWEGEDVFQRSSELIHTGEVNKISKGNCQERVFFLFDHQLIYCKKDMLKKNVLVYKGRIDMDSCNIEWLRDGEEHHNGSSLSNAWKMFNETKDKWYIVYTKKAEKRDSWMKAFQDERARVKEDANSGVVISQSTRQAAMQAYQSSIKGRKPSVKKEKLSKTLPSPGSGSNVKRSLSPSIPLPAPVSSADLKEQVSLKEKDAGGFLQRTSQLRRSFGLRGSKRSKDKEKRSSSIF